MVLKGRINETYLQTNKLLMLHMHLIVFRTYIDFERRTQLLFHDY